MIKNIILLGPPGSGKGTQAKKISTELGYLYFGTGELMRQEAQKGTELGQKFQAVWNHGKGELVEDALVEEFVNQKIDLFKNHDKIIFDGYPRTILQVKHLENILNLVNKDIWVLNLKVRDETSIERMRSRRVCENCGKTFFQAEKNHIEACPDCGGKLIHRQEDQEEIFSKRLDVYNRQTKPLIDYFKSINKLIEIDGEGTIPEVEALILKELDGHN